MAEKTKETRGLTPQEMFRKKDQVRTRLTELKQELKQAINDREAKDVHLNRARLHLSGNSADLNSRSLVLPRQETSGRERQELEKAVMLAESSLAEVEQCITEIRGQITETEKELQSYLENVTTNDLLEVQNRLNLAEEKIAGIEKASSDLEARLNTEETTSKQMAALVQKREDLLADILTGNATSKDLEKLDREIAKAREDAEKKKANGTDIQTMKQTRAGLQRKLAKAQSELKEIKAEAHELVFNFFMSEAEKAGKSYMRQAQDLVTTFNRLFGLGEILNTRFSKVIIPGSWDRMTIPAFLLKACSEKPFPFADGETIYQSYQRQAADMFEKEESSQLESLRSLGIMFF